MPTFHGRAVAPTAPGSPAGASGPIRVTVPPRGRPGFVTGEIKIGSMPRQGLTGFSAPYLGGDEFEAAGQNTRGEGLNQMHLAVIIRGRVAFDGRTVAGTVTAVVNGVDQPEWTFAAAIEGVELPSEIPTNGAVGSFDPGAEAVSMQEPGLLDRIPGAAKVAAALVAAAGGLYLWRRSK